MRPDEIVPLRPIRALGKVSPAPTLTPAQRPEDRLADPALPVVVARRSNIDAGSSPPVDTARVDQIRKAIEEGTYPLIPTRIADAMIAAGLLLRNGQ